MTAFLVSVAVLKARTPVEQDRLMELLELARAVDDRESGFSEALFANRRSHGFAEFAVARPVSKKAREVLDEVKASEARMLEHLHSLDPSAILEHAEVTLSSTTSLWNGLEGPLEEVDRPLIDSLNQERERLLCAIRKFRAQSE